VAELTLQTSRPFFPSRAEAGEFEALARKVERLTLSRTNPERFFEDKSQLAYELRMLARRRHA
jgi:hypothetical protein